MTATAAPTPPLNLTAHKLLSFPALKQGPRRDVPAPLTSNLSRAEAHDKTLKEYTIPTWFECEVVWYRAKHGRHEDLAVIYNEAGKKFDLVVLENGRPNRLVKNVAYYDPDRRDQSDPSAAFSDAGTFRKSMFSLLLYQVLSGSAEVSFAEFEDRIKAVERKVDNVPDQRNVDDALKKLNEMQARLQGFSDSLGTLTADLKKSGMDQLYRRMEKLEGDFTEVIRSVGATVIDESEAAPNNVGPPPTPASPPKASGKK